MHFNFAFLHRFYLFCNTWTKIAFDCPLQDSFMLECIYFRLLPDQLSHTLLFSFNMNSIINFVFLANKITFLQLPMLVIIVLHLT